MHVIYFTQGATDPLHQIRTRGALRPARGRQQRHPRELPRVAASRLTTPSISHAATLLVVHGGITVLESAEATTNINIHAGSGQNCSQHRRRCYGALARP
jgi:hypothetical protein